MEMTLEQKYHYAILALQAIAQRNGRDKEGYYDEWTEAESFRDCREAARRCLLKIGEPTKLVNTISRGIS